ncbi:MAG: VTT domain-containing protein [Bacteroidia bacterium]|nr:VTT domain-containing protein [Bacteroidia bacterium]MDW8416314.1 VTT domain-containing protein [Bacteroidia bacterium]
MQELIELFRQLIDPEKIIQIGGLGLVTAVVFAETGLMIGFFLPGDSLLFTVGLFCALGILPVPVGWVLVSLIFAAIVGDQVGYWTGRFLGQRLFEKQDSRFFKRKYLDQTRAFYQRWGGSAIILGRFVPIVRTFAPILAGAVQFPPRTFILYNVFGGLFWVLSLVLAGYGLGSLFPWLKKYIELIALGIIFLSVLPLLSTWWKERRRLRMLSKA